MNTVEVRDAVKSYEKDESDGKILQNLNMTIKQGSM
jgi:ABC-type dipeptide/oligopeptide/nickel transport system ATPase subunit